MLMPKAASIAPTLQWVETRCGSCAITSRLMRTRSFPPSLPTLVCSLNDWVAGELGERARIAERIARTSDHQIVTAVLALLAHHARYPAHDGVIEEQRFDDHLQEIDEVVVAPHMCELVHHDELEVPRGSVP